MRINRFLTVCASTSVIACAGLAGPAQAANPPTPPGNPPVDEHTFVAGTFAAYADDEEQTAITYDPELVPAGAGVAVTSYSIDDDDDSVDDVADRGIADRPYPGHPPRKHNGSTVTSLGVDGLAPNRDYGAHVHTEPCGEIGDDAGPHFQYFVDPNQPSTDPRYANPYNEVWLDFTTSEDGDGFAGARVPWTFPDDRRPASVVIHEHHTSMAPGEAGTAGARLACINVDF